MWVSPTFHIFTPTFITHAIKFEILFTYHVSTTNRKIALYGFRNSITEERVESKL